MLVLFFYLQPRLAFHVILSSLETNFRPNRLTQNLDDPTDFGEYRSKLGLLPSCKSPPLTKPSLGIWY